jgi:hypothetical protein
MGLCRAITAFFISPAAAIGSAVVAETFFKKDRARCMGVWTLLVTLGVPSAPFIFGFAAQRVGYRWIYWALAICNGVQFFLYLLLGPESLYVRKENGTRNVASVKESMFKFGRIDPAPLRFWDFIQPLSYFAKPCVFIPAAAYAMIFLWGSVMISIEIPQLFPAMYGLDTQQVGLTFLGVIIGSVIGEQIGGFISDRWMSMCRKRIGQPPKPEFRLWLTYIGYVLTIVGIVVFCIQLRDSGPKWNVTPIIGAAVAAAGNQIVTTINITYAVDCYREDAASVGVFITFVRQIWGFIGPFWYDSCHPLIIDQVLTRPQVPSDVCQCRLGRWCWHCHGPDGGHQHYSDHGGAVVRTEVALRIWARRTLILRLYNEAHNVRFLFVNSMPSPSPPLHFVLTVCPKGAQE